MPCPRDFEGQDMVFTMMYSALGYCLRIQVPLQSAFDLRATRFGLSWEFESSWISVGLCLRDRLGIAVAEFSCDGFDVVNGFFLGFPLASTCSVEDDVERRDYGL